MLAGLLNKLVSTVRLLRSSCFIGISRVRFSGVEWGGRNLCEVGARISISGDGQLRIGEETSLARHASLFVRSGELLIGARSYIGIGCVIAAQESIIIGDDVLIAEYVTIRDQDHNFHGPGLTARNGFVTEPIKIGSNVWLGAKSTVTKGVVIGDNAVIGANSVVTTDIPADSVAVGVPARVVRRVTQQR